LDVKKALGGVLNFNQRTVTQDIRQPAAGNQAGHPGQESDRGMTRDELILAMGRLSEVQRKRGRSGPGGLDLRQPARRVTFVTLKGSKVVKVKDSSPNLGAAWRRLPSALKQRCPICHLFGRLKPERQRGKGIRPLCRRSLTVAVQYRVHFNVAHR